MEALAHAELVRGRVLVSLVKLLWTEKLLLSSIYREVNIYSLCKVKRNVRCAFHDKIRNVAAVLL